MMNIQIIKADLKYVSGFRENLDAVAREEKFILFLEAPPLASVEEFVKKNIANNVPQCFALDGENVVGWCDVSPLSRKTIDHRGSLGMGVVASHRGKGIGSLLPKETLAWAKERGLEKVELEVYAGNSSAIGLYKKFGFIEEGRIKKGRKHKGQYEDMILMGLFL